MRRMSILAAAPLAALLLAGPVIAGAQEDATGDEPGSRVVSPAECTVEPAAADAIAAALTDGAPAAGIQVQIPLGQPADPETGKQVATAVRGILACLNAGDFLRVGALTTPNGAKALLSGLAAGGPEALNESLAAAPVAREEAAYVRLLAVTDPAIAADGRIVAFAVINEPVRPPRGPETLLFAFANDNGVLKLDSLLGFSLIQPEGAATPAAEGTPAP